MINWALLQASKQKLATDFRSPSKPFPWLMMDGFLLEGVPERLAQDFDEAPAARSRPVTEMKHQVLKRGTVRWDEFSQLQRQFFEAINGDEFVGLLSEITGISPLYPDAMLHGGGAHEILPGGYLNVHTDFNFHPHLRKLRALNLLLYLNADWKPEWNGAIELWDPDMLARHARIEPIINRMVLFQTNEVSFHGHPMPLSCPQERTRRSLAVYYYTDWPAEHGVRLGTNYQLTPGQWALLVSEIAKRLEAGVRDLAIIGDQLIGRWQRKDVETAFRFLTGVRTAYTYGEAGQVPPKIDILARDPNEGPQVDWIRPNLVASPHVQRSRHGLESVGDDPYFWIEGDFERRDVTRLHVSFNWSNVCKVNETKFYFDFGEGSSEELSRVCPAQEGNNHLLFTFNRPLRKLRFDPVAWPGPLPDFDIRIGF
jgi:hypothetical protein